MFKVWPKCGPVIPVHPLGGWHKFLNLLTCVLFSAGLSPLLKVSTVCASVLIALRWFRPLMLKYLLPYTLMVFNVAYSDHDRHEAVDRIHATTEWRLHQLEMQFNKDLCKSAGPTSSNRVAWLTAMTNDDFVIGAVATAYMINRLSCHKEMIALVSSGVSAAGALALTKAGYDVKVVEPLDCNWMDRKKGRAEQSSGIVGTHMRFHAWNFTQYDKLLYFDADIVPLTNVDDLFEMDSDFAAAYCSKPGVVDPCFNAGLLVFRPSAADYTAIMELWDQLSDTGCPNDQVLLWHYYADNGRWTPIPYAYNVRRQMYHPMKLYHFACCLTPKPWRLSNPPDRAAALRFKGPLIQPMDVVITWWKYFYQAIDLYDLKQWWQNAANTIRRNIDH